MNEHQQGLEEEKECVAVAVFFVVVLAVIFFIGLIN